MQVVQVNGSRYLMSKGTDGRSQDWQSLCLTCGTKAETNDVAIAIAPARLVFFIVGLIFVFVIRIFAAVAASIVGVALCLRSAAVISRCPDQLHLAVNTISRYRPPATRQPQATGRRVKGSSEKARSETFFHLHGHMRLRPLLHWRAGHGARGGNKARHGVHARAAVHRHEIVP